MNWPAQGPGWNASVIAEGIRLSEGAVKSHCSSLHIQADNWALRRSRSHRVPTVMRKSAALGSLCFYGDGGRNRSGRAGDLCNNKHLRLMNLAVKGWRHGEEGKYRIIWSHMSVNVKLSPSFSPIAIRYDLILTNTWWTAGYEVLTPHRDNTAI